MKLKRKIIWRNIGARLWLLAHGGRWHLHKDMTTLTWTCSCGSTYKVKPGPRSGVR